MNNPKRDRVRFWCEFWFLMFAASALAVIALLFGGAK